MTMECVEKVIRKDMIDPTNGKKMKEKDIIPLQRVSQQRHILHLVVILRALRVVVGRRGTETSRAFVWDLLPKAFIGGLLVGFEHDTLGLLLASDPYANDNCGTRI